MTRTDLVKRTAFAVLATGFFGAAVVTPAAAAPLAAAPSAPQSPVFGTSWQDLLPPPLDCLISTGWAAFCLGVPLS
ncbi:hypothetical protein [Nocardia sp. NBC_01388]|uniref:hypothetical protein n=1 Tax=Nocardia sp. NBC_01388 TaxID=2903596 RepID=UPI0032546B1F